MGTKDLTHEAIAQALTAGELLTHEQRGVLLGLVADDKVWQRECDTLRHQVICCGVAASHPDSALTTAGEYAGKWNSRQAEEVRALRRDRDSLRLEVERLRTTLDAAALSPFLTDVVTAAGLLEHGKRDKGLAKRMADSAWELRLRALGPNVRGNARLTAAQEVGDEQE